MNNRVLLLGASGQLGSVIEECTPSHYKLFSCSSTQLDITNPLEVERVLLGVLPALIINAAAYTHVDKAEQDIERAFLVNDKAIEIIANLANKETRIIHFSTDFVFDGAKGSAYLIDDKTSPLSVYGRSKLAGEEKLLRLKNDKSIVIRTAWVYSAKGKNFVNTMLQLFKTRDELSVVNDQIGTPTSANSLAKVTWRFIETDAFGTFHWTDRGQTSWYDFACTIQKRAFEIGLLEKKIPIKPVKTGSYPTPAKRPQNSVLDKQDTYKVIGFEGKPWEEELFAVLDQIKALSRQGNWT